MIRNRYKATCDVCRCQVKVGVGQVHRIPGGWAVRHDDCRLDHPTPDTLLSIEADHFVAGISLKNDQVVEAAPILKYMHGWQRSRVESYCDTKNWKVVEA